MLQNNFSNGLNTHQSSLETEFGTSNVTHQQDYDLIPVIPNMTFIKPNRDTIVKMRSKFMSEGMFKETSIQEIRFGPMRKDKQPEFFKSYWIGNMSKAWHHFRTFWPKWKLEAPIKAARPRQLTRVNEFAFPVTGWRATLYCHIEGTCEVQEQSLFCYISET